MKTQLVATNYQDARPRTENREPRTGRRTPSGRTKNKEQRTKATTPAHPPNRSPAHLVAGRRSSTRRCWSRRWLRSTCRWTPICRPSISPTSACAWLGLPAYGRGPDAARGARSAPRAPGSLWQAARPNRQPADMAADQGAGAAGQCHLDRHHRRGVYHQAARVRRCGAREATAALRPRPRGCASGRSSPGSTGARLATRGSTR